MGKALGLFGLELGGGAAVNASDYGHYMIANITERGEIKNRDEVNYEREEMISK